MSRKQQVYGLLHRSGLWRAFGRKARGAIFMLHRVVRRHGDDDFRPNLQFAITEGVLRTILDTLAAHEIEVVSLDEAARRIEARSRHDKRFACLTFDDGYRDNYELAFPIFAERGLPMATYVSSGLVARSDTAWWFALEEAIRACSGDFVLECGASPHARSARSADEKAQCFDFFAQLLQRAPREQRIRALAQLRERYGVDAMAMTDELVMDWASLRRFATEPLVTIGAHTVSHAALATLNREEMRTEMQQSRAQLEAELGSSVQHFAFPYGDPSTTGVREFDACRELGFRTATTTRHGLVTASDASAMHSLPRIPTDPFETRETIAVKLSGIPAFLQSLRRKRAS